MYEAIIFFFLFPFQFPFFLGKLRCCSKKRSFLALGLGQGRGVICSEKYIERGRPYVGEEEYIISPSFLFFFRTKNFLFYDPFLPSFRQLSTHTRVSPFRTRRKKKNIYIKKKYTIESSLDFLWYIRGQRENCPKFANFRGL